MAAATAGAATSGEGPEALEVVYCGVCGLPPEYCAFGPSYERCVPWLKVHFPSVLSPEERGEDGEAAGATAGGEAATGAGAASAAASASSAKDMDSAEAAAEAAETAARPAQTKAVGGKAPKVLVQSKQVKGRKKWLTLIAGAEHFGVKLKDVKKGMSGKFAASASITENAKGTKMVQVGGEVAEEAALFLGSEYGIPLNRIFVMQGKKAIPATSL